MSKKRRTKFVFREKAKTINEFPCCALVHQISKGGTQAVWDKAIGISHPYAELAQACQRLRSGERTKNGQSSAGARKGNLIKYTQEFELQCRAFLSANRDSIYNLEGHENISAILEQMEKLGIKQIVSATSSPKAPSPEKV